MPIIQTPRELGLTIRSRRKELGWDQATLAAQVGVTRQWVIDIEKGKPRAELGLALRALRVLGLSLNVEAKRAAAAASGGESGMRPTGEAGPDLDIDAIVESNRRAAASRPAALPGAIADYRKELEMVGQSDAPASQGAGRAVREPPGNATVAHQSSEPSRSGVPGRAADYLKALKRERGRNDVADDPGATKADHRTGQVRSTGDDPESTVGTGGSGSKPKAGGSTAGRRGAKRIGSKPR